MDETSASSRNTPIDSSTTLSDLQEERERTSIANGITNYNERLQAKRKQHQEAETQVGLEILDECIGPVSDEIKKLLTTPRRGHPLFAKQYLAMFKTSKAATETKEQQAENAAKQAAFIISETVINVSV